MASTVVATLSPPSSRRLLSRPPRLPSSPSSSSSSSPPSSSTSFSHRSHAASLPKGRALASAAALLASGAGLALALALAAASANALPSGASAVLHEPENALSLPTWAVHVSSVIEWVAAMALVWEYGEKSGFPSWKGLSWGMVPLLGGALCACTWHFFYNSESLEARSSYEHFFYNSESLEILVAIQGALTVIGNMTMCMAAFRIFKASREGSKSS